MMDATLHKFGYPETLIKEYNHWRLLCRKEQVTLGALILISKDEQAISFSQLSTDSFIEFELIVKEVETKLKAFLGYEKINYLMLMMVDPEVHFHIVPRYSKDKKFADSNFIDKGWPKLPDLGSKNELDDATFKKLTAELKETFLRK